MAHLLLEADEQKVEATRAARAPVFYGDASRPDTLLAAGLMQARLVVLTFAHAQQALRLAQAIAERRPALTVLCGAILGVLVSLSSIGAGALGATMILLLYPRLDMKRLVGSDIAHAVPLTIVAGIGHASLGNVDWEILVELLIGSIPAIRLSAKLTKHLPETITRFALCACLVLAAKKVLLTA